MEIIEARLPEYIDKIIGIAKISFNNFYSKEQLLERIKDKKHGLYIVKEGEKFVGFKIWYIDNDYLYDWLDAVHPDYRKKGIATNLMRILFNKANELSYNKIILKTHEGHPEMISLCKKLGFIEIKRELYHWGNKKTAIFFEKSL